MGEQPYTLEVGSPGVDRPLTEPRHFRRNVCRLVTITPLDGPAVTGRITAAGEPGVTLEVPAAKQEPAAVRGRGVCRRVHGPPCRSSSRGRPATTTTLRRTDMDIDLAALRALERERDISLDVLIPAIEQALLVAYHRTDGAYRVARVELDRKTGHVVVWAREESELPEPERASRTTSGSRRAADAASRPEFDDTPNGFGRIAAVDGPAGHRAAAARPRGRRRSSATSRAARATSSPASSSRAPTRASCTSTSAPSRGSCRWPSRCPARVHARRAAALLRASGRARTQGPADRAVAHPPQPRAQALRARGARDRRRHRRDRGAGPRGRPPHQDRRARQGRRASTPRAPASARWAPACAPS